MVLVIGLDAWRLYNTEHFLTAGIYRLIKPAPLLGKSEFFRAESPCYHVLIDFTHTWVFLLL